MMDASVVSDEENSPKEALTEIQVEENEEDVLHLSPSWWNDKIWNNYWVWIVTSSLLATFMIWVGAKDGPGYGEFEIRGPFDENGIGIYPYQLAHPKWYHHFIPYVGYTIHQTIVFYIIWKAQSSNPKYTEEFQPFNWSLIKVNSVFVVIKYAQSHLTYNGLSSTLPVNWGIGTVATMLYIFAIVRISKRGLFYGKVRTKPHWLNITDCVQFAKKYHAYPVALFIINDFWFHPTEGSLGHLAGFMYDYLLLWEMSMIFNRRHKNVFWTFFLESFVVVHASIMAWTSIRFEVTGHYTLMFVYGTAIIVVVTNMHILNPGVFVSVGVTLVLVGTILVGYLLYDPISEIHSVIRIPLMEYVAIFYFLLMYRWESALIRKCTKEGSKMRTLVAVVATALTMIPPILSLYAFRRG